ncbi:hypothetical protein [Chryseobacterium shigense]|uniref:Uncharacterized protein n=1 Tax=Chryseobacterium shigense TaxID=297244 RepID=A0A841NCD3_9FLAO|nr:hypothetical protein [Chryseobacterium shigense]MBB6372673.1 hypothetical protein [Chryseobacterium shigense]
MIVKTIESTDKKFIKLALYKENKRKIRAHLLYSVIVIGVLFYLINDGKGNAGFGISVVCLGISWIVFILIYIVTRLLRYMRLLNNSDVKLIEDECMVESKKIIPFSSGDSLNTSPNYIDHYFIFITIEPQQPTEKAIEVSYYDYLRIECNKRIQLHYYSKFEIIKEAIFNNEKIRIHSIQL